MSSIFAPGYRPSLVPARCWGRSTVKESVVGSNIEFEEHGEHELKGVPGKWRLFALTDKCA
jgi:class 3 adenylate cyclase